MDQQTQIPVKGFIDWITKLVTGTDGLPSTRRIVALWFVALETLLLGGEIFFMNRLAYRDIDVAQDKLTMIKDLFEFSQEMVCAMTLLVLGIVTVQQVIDLKTIKKAEVDGNKTGNTG